MLNIKYSIVSIDFNVTTSADSKIKIKLFRNLNNCNKGANLNLTIMLHVSAEISAYLEYKIIGYWYTPYLCVSFPIADMNN